MKILRLVICFIFMFGVFESCISESSETSEAPKVSEENISTSETSEITCPHCGHKKIEVLPTEVCQIKYQCENCQKTIVPKDGDCCVFCSYGTHKCPSMQEE